MTKITRNDYGLYEKLYFFYSQFVVENVGKLIRFYTIGWKFGNNSQRNRWTTQFNASYQWIRLNVIHKNNGDNVQLEFSVMMPISESLDRTDVNQIKEHVLFYNTT